ncbi:MAG: ABC transporter permease [Halobacteriota archaeon]
MRFVSLAIKGLKQALRDRRSLFFLLLFPVVFMIIFAFAFGSPSSLGTGTTTHEIAVINQDIGATRSVNGTAQHFNAGENFTQVLANITYAQTDTPMFHINNVSVDKAETMLKSRSLDAAVIIPANFSQSVVALTNATARAETTSDIGLSVINASAAQNAGGGAASPAGIASAGVPTNTTLPRVNNVTSQVIIEGDTGTAAFGATQALLFNVLNQYTNQLQGGAMRQVDAALGQNQTATRTNYLSAIVQPLTGTRSFTLFDYQAPGLIVFALLIQTSTIAQDLAREAERGTLGRLKLSNMRSFDLLFGTLLTWIVIAVAQILLLFAVAIAVGFNWAGGVNSLVLAVLVGVIGGIASISLGLLIAAFATNERQAAQLGVLIAVPVSFLTGAFFPLPNETLGSAFGTTFQVYDVLPWTQVADALRQILVFGSGFSAVAVYVGLAIVLTAILFILGVVCYARVRLRPQ